jgi:hypothetical protein
MCPRTAVTRIDLRLYYTNGSNVTFHYILYSILSYQCLPLRCVYLYECVYYGKDVLCMCPADCRFVYVSRCQPS